MKCFSILKKHKQICIYWKNTCQARAVKEYSHLKGHICCAWHKVAALKCSTWARRHWALKRAQWQKFWRAPTHVWKKKPIIPSGHVLSHTKIGQERVPVSPKKKHAHLFGCYLRWFLFMIWNLFVSFCLFPILSCAFLHKVLIEIKTIFILFYCPYKRNNKINSQQDRLSTFMMGLNKIIQA